MKTGSYQFELFNDKQKEMDRLNLQANLLAENEINFLKISGLTDNMDVLDIGCGMGNTVNLLNENFANLNITGIDSNPEFIDCCQLESKSNMQFIQSDVYNLGAIPEKFDFIYARFLFQHLVYPEKVLQEALKTLKPNGIMVVLDVDDSSYRLTPPSKNLTLFLDTAENAQIKNGGDRRIGHKLKEYFTKCNYQNIVEVKQRISSKNIGLINFLNITTGLKIEHIGVQNKAFAENLLQSAYTEAINNNAEGELNLYGVRGQKIN